jgi:hypothetical protein
MDLIKKIMNVKIKMNTEKQIDSRIRIKPKMESPDVYTILICLLFNKRRQPEKSEGICKYVQYSTDWNWLMEVVQKCY